MFISFEGGEGSGKTTLMQKLKAALEIRGRAVIATRGPGGTPLGKQIRELLLNPDLNLLIGARAELMLYLADRAQLNEEVIRPALAEGKVVLCDRYNDSSVAYQGMARGLGIKEVGDLCNLVCQGLKPDLTFFLDVDPKVGFSRITAKHDRLEKEKIQFHEQVRQAFQAISHQARDRIHTIDASLPPKYVFSEALQVVEKKLNEITL